MANRIWEGIRRKLDGSWGDNGGDCVTALSAAAVLDDRGDEIAGVISAPVGVGRDVLVLEEADASSVVDIGGKSLSPFCGCRGSFVSSFTWTCSEGDDGAPACSLITASSSFVVIIIVVM